jgi:hypothetical protein
MRLMRAMCWAAVAVMWSSVAAAQNAEYERVIDEAVSEFKLGHWREARALFEQAHAIDPNARTLRGRGMAEFEMRHYTNAARSLAAALRDSRRPLTPTLRDKTEALLQRTRGSVGRYLITLHPQTAVLTVDGQPARFESNGTLLLDAGEHTLSASAPGHELLERNLDVRGGEDEEVTLKLQVASDAAAASTGAGEPYAEAADDDGGSILGEWWFWTAVVAVAAGTTVAVIVLTSGDDEAPANPNVQALVRF